MGKNANFVVDTKNLCFLCFRPAKIIAAGVKGRVKDKTFSLRCISRFLNVNFQKMLKTVVPSVCTQEGVVKFPQVSVTVCSRCSAVTEEFATLYQYMEFTQMKINACVRNLNELMKKTDNNSRLVEKFRKKMKTVGDTGEADAVESMRTRMVENCSVVLKNAYPRVKVRKFEKPSPKGVKGTKVVGGLKPGPRSKKPGFSSTILKKDALNGNVKESSKIEGILGKNSDHESPETKDVSGIFQCLHCDDTFTETGGLRVHIVGCHPEQFFQMFKNSNLSDADFKVAVELLFQDVRKITANCGNQSTVSYVCTCCGKPFSAKIDTYVHMVQLHHDVLSTKLQSIQKDASLIAAARKTTQLPDPSGMEKRRKIRGPYKKKNKTGSEELLNSTSFAYDTTTTLVPKKKKRNNIHSSVKKLNQTGGKMTFLAKNVTLVFPKTCECGVQLSSRPSWNNHQRKHCKLKIGETQPKVIPTINVKHTLLKRAKNTVGFPRTCACGVRLKLRSSWNNHQKMHCKLKFGGKSNVGSVAFLNNQFENPMGQTPKKKKKATMKKKKGKFSGVPVITNELESVQLNRNKYACECGSNLTNYQSWYHHKTRSCRLRTDNGTENVELDYIEEVPIDITPSGELCLPGTSSSIETSPIPKIMKVTSGGGVIKGLQHIANFQNRLKRETETKPAAILDTNMYSDLFSKYLPIGTPVEEIVASLEKVLQEYKKFSGNISGCPWCGRGFSQVSELQNHMVEAHFEDVVSRLKNLIDPSGMKPCNFDGVINMDPIIVKNENDEMEVDVGTNNLSTMDSQQYSHEFQPNCMYMEENDYNEAIPKEEQIGHSHDESIANDGGGDQLLILP